MQMNERIKQLRRKHYLTQQELAKLIGAKQTQVSQWEIGEVVPSIFNAICLADVFGVSLDALCCRDFKGDK